MPFYPELINDGFAGREPGLLEKRLLEEIQRASVLSRTRVRSFDHRSLAAMKTLEPAMSLAVLMADETAPLHPGRLAREVGAKCTVPIIALWMKNSFGRFMTKEFASFRGR